MLRQRDAFTFLVALSVWLALVLLAVTAILSLTAQAWGATDFDSINAFCAVAVRTGWRRAGWT